MKFIHAADIHLGAQPDKGKPWSQLRKKEIQESFLRLIRKANEQEVDFLFLSGDIFHRPPSVQDLREFDYMLQKLDHTKTVLIAGNHDHIGEHSPYKTYEFQSETYVLSDHELEHIYFKEEETFVYGLSYWKQEIHTPCFESAKPLDKDGIHILLAHGGDPKHMPMDLNALKWSGFDYIALGHIHKPQVIFEDLMAYPGSLEPLDATETGPHGYMMGEITEEKQIVTFVPFACRSYQEAEIVLYDTMSAMEIYEVIANYFELMGRENLFHLRLTGSMDPKITLDLTELEETYYIVSIEQEQTTYGDFEQTLRENEDNLIGAVMRKLRDRPEALSYAMKALLVTAKEQP